MSLMTLKSSTKSKRNRTGGFKYDMKDLMNSQTSTLKFENFTSMRSFCLKHIRFELKQYRGVIFHDTKQ